MIKVVKPSKELVIMGLMVSALAAPVAVRAYTNGQDGTSDSQVQTAEIADNNATAEDQSTSNTTTQDTPATTVNTQTTQETPVEDPSTTVDADGVTLAEAQIIAETEHPNVTLKKVTTKVVDGAAAYAFYFEDGWKVYVRAADGVVVKVQDGSQKQHNCKNKLKDDPQFQNWLQSQKENRKHTEKPVVSTDSNDDQQSDQNSNRKHSRKHSQHQ